MTSTAETTRAADNTHTLTMSRKFPVPAQRLFDAWNIPEQTCRWMGPRTVDCRIDDWDFREGGQYEIVMISNEGNEFPAHGVFNTIDPPKHLSMSCAWQHEDMMQGVKTFLELRFEGLDDNSSELHLVYSRMPGGDQAGRHQSGWDGAFECLEEFLTG